MRTDSSGAIISTTSRTQIPGLILLICATVLIVPSASAQIRNETPPPGYPESGCDWDQRGNYYCWGGAGTGSPDRFAAIAYAYDNAMSSGSSHGQTSKDDAVGLAVTNCNSHASGCKTLVCGINTCVALAVSHSDGKWGFGHDSDRDRAKTKSLDQCRSGGGKSCIVQAAPCASDDARYPLSYYSQNAPPNPFLGNWKLNLAKSNFGKLPAALIPKSETVAVVAGASSIAVKFTMQGAGADGKAFRMSFDGALDDKPRPLVGDPDGSSIAFLKAGGWHSVDKNQNLVETGTSSMSADGQSYTNNIVHRFPDGSATSTALVFDRTK